MGRSSIDFEFRGSALNPCTEKKRGFDPSDFDPLPQQVTTTA
jgi:hypothetical protein